LLVGVTQGFLAAERRWRSRHLCGSAATCDE
jgi:hypothetical protein